MGKIMKVKSIRIPEEIEKAIDYVARSEKLDKTSSLRKLTTLGFEYYVAKSYEHGKLTMREAAASVEKILIVMFFEDRRRNRITVIPKNGRSRSDAQKAKRS